MVTSITKKTRAVKDSPAPAATLTVPTVVTAPAKVTRDKSSQVVNQLVGDADLSQTSNLGVDSHKLAFVCSLGDPSESDRAEFKRNGKVETRHLSRIIGYRFKVLEDVMVPDFGTTERFNGKRLNNAKDMNNWVEAKAGEIVDFTRVELLALMSQDTFNMEITGGEYPVRLAVAFARLSNLSPDDPEQLPDVSLSMKDRKSSIKDLPILDVLDYERSNDGKMFAVGTRTLKPEFEGTKFAPRALARTATTLSGTRTKTSAKQDSTKRNQRLAFAANQLVQRVAKAQAQTV